MTDQQVSTEWEGKRTFSIWKILGRSILLAFRNRELMSVAAVLVLINMVISFPAYLDTTMQSPFSWAAVLVSGLFSLALSPVLIISFVQIQEESFTGFRAALNEAAPYLPMLVLVQLITILLALGGAILLVLPGLFIIALLLAVVPVMYFEKTGLVRTLERSVELTRQAMWRIFGLTCVYFLVMIPLNGAIFPTMPVLMRLPLEGVFSWVDWLVGAAYISTLYRELKRIDRRKDSRV